jgi:hypothetical protein
VSGTKWNLCLGPLAQQNNKIQSAPFRRLVRGQVWGQVCQPFAKTVQTIVTFALDDTGRVLSDAIVRGSGDNLSMKRHLR